MDPLDVRRTRAARSNACTPLRETASQTAGPYVHIGCLPNASGINGILPVDLTCNVSTPPGERIRIVGQVFDADAAACRDAVLETWQADARGDYSKGFWRRSWTDLESGHYTIDSVRPGPTPAADGRTLAPCVNVWIVARGINIGLLTRMYFPDLEAENAADPHLALVDPHRRHTLIAHATQVGGEFRFDIHLQGARETVFFAT